MVHCVNSLRARVDRVDPQNRARWPGRLNHEVSIDDATVLGERVVKARVKRTQTGNNLFAVLAGQWPEKCSRWVVNSISDDLLYRT
jgi:hypothetical protein